MILLTPIVAATLWAFSALWLLGLSWLALLALLGGLLLLLFLKVDKKFRLGACSLILLLAMVVPVRSFELKQQNSPVALEKLAWQTSRFSLRIESVGSNLIRARVIQPRSANGARLQLRAELADEVSAGCTIEGSFRLIPEVSRDVSWLLKMQAESSRVDCVQKTPVTMLREIFSESIRSVSSDAGALLSGLAIGDDSKLSQNAKRQMQALSLTHLTAVSGANCAIVIGCIILLLRRAPISRLARTACSILALAGYVLVVGAQPSVMRAATMTLVLALCTLNGRPIRPSHSLAFALIILIVVYPFFAVDLGFALSMAATFGLLTLTPMIYRWLRRRLPSWLAGSISIAAAAQIWCLPLLLELQGGLPTYSLVANALAEPLVAPITILGLIAFCLSPVLPQVAGLVSWLGSVFAGVILWIAKNLTTLPVLTLWWPSGASGTLLLLLFALAISLFALNRKALAGLLMALSVAWLSGSTASAVGVHLQWPIANWSIVNCDVGQGDALVLRSQGEIALVDVGREDKPVDDCLAHLGVTKIDLLVLTHFDMDHVGGLRGALLHREVGKVLLTEFSDSRPQAAWFTKQLQGVGEIVRVHAGMQGTLGEVTWTVLQPEAGGLGSEDSNDGSVAMRWDSPNFSLFTMADLGERGQMRLVQKHPGWISVDHDRPIVLKVSHHGSADQYPELIESWQPDVALISVGVKNPYGHPTQRLLNMLKKSDTEILRTDQSGGLSLSFDTQRASIRVGVGG